MHGPLVSKLANTTSGQDPPEMLSSSPLMWMPSISNKVTAHMSKRTNQRQKWTPRKDFARRERPPKSIKSQLQAPLLTSQRRERRLNKQKKRLRSHGKIRRSKKTTRITDGTFVKIVND
jgi:hypothetical protein